MAFFKKFIPAKKEAPKSALPMLRFRNTLSGEVEPFVPLKPGTVLMYNCGPTVYGTQHIGNMRAAVFADTIRLVLEAWHFKVKQVINITDLATSQATPTKEKTRCRKASSARA